MDTLIDQDGWLPSSDFFCQVWFNANLSTLILTAYNVPIETKGEKECYVYWKKKKDQQLRTRRWLVKGSGKIFVQSFVHERNQTQIRPGQNS